MLPYNAEGDAQFTLTPLSVYMGGHGMEARSGKSHALREPRKGDHMRSEERRRRFYLVNRSLQYRFLAMIIIYTLAMVLFLAVFLFLPDMIRLHDEGLSLASRAAAAEKILTLHARVWPAVIAIICIFGVHALRSSQRILGPMYRFRSIFEQVGNGDLSMRVKIRDKDFLHQEEGALNGMIETLSEKIRTVQRAGLEAARSLHQLERGMTQGPSGSEIRTDLLRIHRQHLETLVKTTRYFRVQAPKQRQGGAGHDG